MNAKNIFGAFTLAIALFFVWPAIIGSWQEVGALRSALAERELLSQQRSDILSKTATAYTAYQSLLSSDAGRNFSELVPVSKNTAEIVSAVQAIAGNSGTQLTQVQITEAKPKVNDQYRTMTLTMEMIGSYPGLRTFLANLERYVRILNVNSIQVSSDQTTGQFKFAIKADTYFLK